MITSEMIERINFLAKKKREIGLTEKEKEEQQELYKIYLQSIRAQLKDQLDRIKFVEPDKFSEDD